MKRTLLTGILGLATGISALMAQAPPAGQQPAGQPAGQTGAGATQAPPVTEQSLLNAMISAQRAGNADASIKAAEDLLTQFPNSQLKEAALSVEAEAYRMKKDNTAAQAKWEEVLKVDPKSIQANLKIGEIIATGIKEKDLSREEEVAQANKYINAAFELLKTAPKPNASLADADWEGYKKEMEAEGHDALGIMNLNIKKYDAAIQEFQQASASDPQPAYAARMAAAMDSAGKYADAIAACDKLLADPQLHPAIKDFVTKLKAQATANQQKAAPAAK
jgi:tetratricopeptide (TPR) repeat protein